ncbi:MAG: cytochrome c [Nitrospirales bacterium]|nr:cytochrome c [Nitrospirales bacterium]
MKPNVLAGCRRCLSMVLVISTGVLLWGCPKDMEEQPSFSSQEAPRLHSPEGSIPQVGPPSSHTSLEQANVGAHLFSINCSHCHGPEGIGDGPVAGFLPELPANLQAPAVQQKPDDELYGIVTNGEKVMPAFDKFLSREERWMLVSFVRSLVDSPTFKAFPQESGQTE